MLKNFIRAAHGNDADELMSHRKVGSASVAVSVDLSCREIQYIT